MKQKGDFFWNKAERKPMKQFKRAVFAISTSMMAFAATPNELSSEKVLIEHEVETIMDDEGNVYEIEINRYRNMKNIDTKGIFPEHEVGYIDTFEFKITNQQLGYVGFAGGTPVPNAVKKEIAKIVANKLSTKIGASLLPGINIASWVLSGIALINAQYGNNGFIVTVECEYSSVYIHSQGHEMYGWDLKGIDMDTY